ncbi:MAG: agmatine deiminase family protein [Kiritimatiellae bacterium]|nr:agmatine deiminase family protein [Kiritimatiellia bacterium]
MPRRLPAEWEPQDAILLCWPHSNTDWAPYLEQAETVFLNILAVLTRFERVVLVASDSDEVRGKCQVAGIPPNAVLFAALASNDTWARDFGPITICEEDGKPVLLDFQFNGWGGKFEAALDNQITRTLHRQGLFGGVECRRQDLILEGGSIESDGQGSLLTTAACLLNPNRNPPCTKRELEALLRKTLGAEHLLWLQHGFLAGDDTDSHIDTLARFAPNHTILYVQCDDPHDEHYEELRLMEEELRQFKTPNGQPYRLLPLPWPNAQHDETGQRLPATYANFLVANGAVLAPTYNDPHDAEALRILQSAFPDREIIGIDCSVLIRQHGSLHCLTMQLPQGVLP